MMDPALDVLAAIKRPSGGEAFARPLRFGDAEQIRILRIMNGGRPYCPLCFDVLEGGGVSDVGDPCRQCRGAYYVPGAAIEARWLRYSGLEEFEG